VIDIFQMFFEKNYEDNMWDRIEPLDDIENTL